MNEQTQITATASAGRDQAARPDPRSDPPTRPPGPDGHRSCTRRSGADRAAELGWRGTGSVTGPGLRVAGDGTSAADSTATGSTADGPTADGPTAALRARAHGGEPAPISPAHPVPEPHNRPRNHPSVAGTVHPSRTPSRRPRVPLSRSADPSRRGRLPRRRPSRTACAESRHQSKAPLFWMFARGVRSTTPCFPAAP
ncbi:hypothetical protein FRAAL3842 [Frankia alni ACN14a]|uniref:Uncharacterized protein n=1 Tax=Frankia alni (strain DSM 45986 / CECT 9034 / ACN14a) TaxID=326424 RepID=Q0RJ29_FRAAA|nr:hypothetical protein FRAAL3842 [Frankia alni ACN14a]